MNGSHGLHHVDVNAWRHGGSLDRWEPELVWIHIRNKEQSHVFVGFHFKEGVLSILMIFSNLKQFRAYALFY